MLNKAETFGDQYFIIDLIFPFETSVFSCRCCCYWPAACDRWLCNNQTNPWYQNRPKQQRSGGRKRESENKQTNKQTTDCSTFDHGWSLGAFLLPGKNSRPHWRMSPWPPWGSMWSGSGSRGNGEEWEEGMSPLGMSQQLLPSRPLRLEPSQTKTEGKKKKVSVRSSRCVRDNERCRLHLSLRSRRGRLAAARAATLQSKCSRDQTNGVPQGDAAQREVTARSPPWRILSCRWCETKKNQPKIIQIQKNFIGPRGPIEGLCSRSITKQAELVRKTTPGASWQKKDTEIEICMWMD